MARKCVVVDLGSVDYATVWDKQKEAVESPERDECDLLYLVEHPPTITIGRSSDRRNVLASEEDLRARGIELLEVDRGGDVTYHGPGQLVAYPILNLNRHKRDVGWYLRALEEAIIRTLLDLEIEALQKKLDSPKTTPMAKRRMRLELEAKQASLEQTRERTEGMRRRREASMMSLTR